MAHAHHHHDHSGHDHGGPTPERALRVAFALNAIFLIIEAAAGFWTNSLALLSDAGHMLSDVGALLIALIAVRLASRKPSKHYTFGLKRAPVLGGLLNGFSLIIIVAFIGFEATKRLGAPPEIDAVAVLGTGVAGLAVNLISAWYLAKSRDQSVNTRGAMLHLLSDALGSVAAIVSAIAIGAFGVKQADPIASLIIGVLILLGSLPLLRDTIRILLQSAPTGLDVQEARVLLLDHPNVDALTDFHIWALDDGEPVLSAVLTVKDTDLRNANQTSDALRALLKEKFHIEHATLECRHTASSAPINHCQYTSEATPAPPSKPNAKKSSPSM